MGFFLLLCFFVARGRTLLFLLPGGNGKDNARVRASFSAVLHGDTNPDKSGLISGQWLSTPRSDRGECEWDETEQAGKHGEADETQGPASVIGWLWLSG